MTLAASPGGVFADALVRTRDVEVTARWSVEALPTEATTVLNVWPRMVRGVGSYRVYITVTPAGRVNVWSAARADDTGGRLSPSARVGTDVVPDQWWNLRIQASGSDPTVLRARVWRDDEPEPTAWQVDVTDATAALQVERDQDTAVRVRLGAYNGDGQTTLPISVRFDDVVISELPPTSTQ